MKYFLKNRRRLIQSLCRFSRARILIVGDLMLDEFVWGNVERISPEAPVPVVAVQKRSVMPGGALNVAHNVRALGGRAAVVGLVGRDTAGRQLRTLIRNNKIESSGVVASNRPTTLKTRIIAQRHQQVVRIDQEQTDGLTSAVMSQLIRSVRRLVPRCDVVCLEDYGKGVISPPLIQETLALARRYRKPVCVDPKEEHLELYRGATVLTPNLHEAEIAAGAKLRTDAALRDGGWRLVEKFSAKAVLITLGERGMSLFERGGDQTFIPTLAREVYDVSGAGDTVVATFALALAAGLDMRDAAFISNVAAGIVVEKVGVAVATRKEVAERIAALGSGSHGG